MSDANLNKVIIGVDVVTLGSKLSDFSYALAILRGDSLTSYDNVSLSRLIRFLWDLRPHIIAVDNVMELGGNKRNLAKILELLPPESRVVQVTLLGGELVDLRKLIREAGINVEQGKLSPRKTAEVLAILASMNYGTELKLFEDKVKIIVGRKRVPGSGGSSADRFKRRVRTSLLGAVKELKRRLEEEGVEYDVIVRRSEGGVDGATFTVYTSRERVQKIVKTIKSPNILIRIKPVVHRKLLNMLYSVTIERYLLIGVDPGIETGLAIIDLDLNPLEITSSKTLDRDEIIQTILKYGIPVMVATDKNPPPDMVEKLAATLNVKLYLPSRSLSNAEKEALISEYVTAYKIDLKNTHERDALAACIKAYKEFEEKFIQFENKLLEIGLSMLRHQKYKAEIIRGSTVAEVVEKVINDYLEREEFTGRNDGLSKTIKMLIHGESSKRIKEHTGNVEKVIRERDQLLRRVNELERQVLALETQLRIKSVELSAELAKDREVAELRQRLENVLNYVRKLEAQISEILSTLDALRNNFNLVFKGDHVLVRRLQELSMDEIIKSSEVLGDIRVNEVVFIEDLNLIDDSLRKKEISELKLKILTSKQLSSTDVMRFYNELGVVVGMCNNYTYINDYLVLVPKKSIEEVKKMELELKKKSSSANKLDYEKLLNIISEYRTLRSTNVLE